MNQKSLNGIWNLKWSDAERGKLMYFANCDFWPDSSFYATVPGEVHTDLIAQGIIEEPQNGRNCLSCRWVEEMYWSYRKEFQLPEEIDLSRDKVYIHFEMLDYKAIIYINGHKAGEHQNAFLPCHLLISDFLQYGNNTVTVVVESGLYEASKHSVNDLAFTSQDLWKSNERLHKRVWLRKPQYSFGWDWSPRLLNVGITGNVSLEWCRDVLVKQVSMNTEVQSDGNGILTVKWITEGLSEDCREKHVDVYPHGVPYHLRNQQTHTEQKGMYGKAEIQVSGVPGSFVYDVEIMRGESAIEVKAHIPQPKLWWCVGYGEPHLYTVTASLTVNGCLLSCDTKEVGFRTLQINQSPTKHGKQFVVELNGVPVFAKGANWVPADIIYSRITPEKYDMLISRALELHFNFFRVWGGGLYETEEFYKQCDKNGIMVWQEFAFACGAYPAYDAGFLDNVKSEVRYQIRRLASHPSLVMWCGNNEQEWHTWDQAQGVMYPDYALYHMVIPRILREEGDNRYYQPSSPLSPDYLFPNYDFCGDQHPWQVGFENEDFRDYRKMHCTFPNEGGFLGSTSRSSIESALNGNNTMYSFEWQIHDNSVEARQPYSIGDHQVKEWMGIDVSNCTLEQYIYISGFLQGEALKEYIQNFRWRKYDSASAVFWMYNDCWPTPRSWTVVDCDGNRNPSFYPVKRAFSPCTCAVIQKDQKFLIYGINDKLESINVRLLYGVSRFDGTNVLEKQKEMMIPANSSMLLAEISAEGFQQTTEFAYCILQDEQQQIISQSRLILPMYRNIKLKKPSIKITVKDGKAIFVSDCFVMGVCLDLDGIERLGDNFFDLFPGQPYTIPWTKSEKPIVLYTANDYLA